MHGEEQVNFAAFKVENDELKMQVKEQQEQIYNSKRR